MSGELAATELKKLGAGTGRSLGAIDFAADRRSVDLVDGVGVVGFVFDVNTVLIGRVVTSTELSTSLVPVRPTTKDTLRTKLPRALPFLPPVSVLL